MLKVLISLLAGAIQLEASGVYKAAVVEYNSPQMPLASADQVLLSNAAVFTEYMANASLNQVDIIVFPEGGLHGHGNRNKFIQLPSPSDSIVPCDHNTSYHPHIVDRVSESFSSNERYNTRRPRSVRSVEIKEEILQGIEQYPAVSTREYSRQFDVKNALVLLSCSARNFHVYAVINLSEQFQNSTTNRTELYNSNVVLDRNGTVVGRYRKYNPYGEPVSKPAAPDHHFFQTDFGVRFGMFICFDIEFLEPAIVMARDYNIKHFVFPHCWISELPFLTALQAQWGWAYSLDVVLLASGCNQPLAGGTGSGIYLGRSGALTTFQTNSQASRLLIATLPVNMTDEKEVGDSTAFTYSEPLNHNFFQKNSKLNEVEYLDDLERESDTIIQENSTLSLLRDYLEVYQSQSLATNMGYMGSPTANSSLTFTETTDTTLCHNSFCCHFQVKMSSTFSKNPSAEDIRGDDFSRLHQRIVVFDGIRWYGGGLATGGVQVCGIVSCANDSITSCGLRADHPSRQVQVYQNSTFGPLFRIGTVFHSISVSAEFKYNSTFVYPNILVSGKGKDFGALAPSNTFTFDSSGPYNKTLTCSLNTLTPISNLITAALYSRQFDRDGQKRTELSSSFAHPHTQSVFLLVVLSLFIFHSILTNIF